MVRLTDRPDMTLDVYRGRKSTTQQQQQNLSETRRQPVRASSIRIASQCIVSWDGIENISIIYQIFLFT